MRICKNCGADMSALPFCTACGGTVPVTAVPARDDLTRIVSLYGRPDRDCCPAQSEGGARRSRTLEYAAAGVVFSFMAEDGANSTRRWKLLIVTDMHSRHAITVHAAAKRLLQ